MDARPSEPWYAAAALVAAGLFFRIVDFRVSWDEALSYLLLGLGLALGLRAFWRTGPAAVGRGLRAHPLLVALLVAFLLLTVIATVTVPPKAE
jgi:hypothetical protein